MRDQAGVWRGRVWGLHCDGLQTGPRHGPPQPPQCERLPGPGGQHARPGRHHGGGDRSGQYSPLSLVGLRRGLALIGRELPSYAI